MAKSSRRFSPEFKQMMLKSPPDTCRCIVVTLCVLLLATCLRAAAPVLTSVLPRGGQRGVEADLVFAGDRLADAQEVIFYTAGLSVKKLDVTSPQQLKVKVAVAADAPLGEHPLRIRTAS